MDRRGFARLMFAMLAAVSLHALLLFLSPPHRPSHRPLRLQAQLLPPKGALQIKLLQHHASAIRHIHPSDKIQTAAITPHHRVKTHKTASTATAQSHPRALARRRAGAQVITAAASDRAIPVQSGRRTLQKAQSPNLAVKKAAKITDRVLPTATRPQAPPHAALASVSGATAVPKNVLQRILAEVYYPMRARRHGWQGRVEFEFKVDEQAIHTITLLSSSGYPILDRAAQHGLALVHQIPLSNGLYRMPVVFHLQ